MKTLMAVAFGVVCGLLGAGVIILVSQAPRGQAVPLYPPPTPLPLTVHVAGAVVNPGVYSLSTGSRVGDSIQFAGGFTDLADPSALNLAALLVDGQRVFVPQKLPTPEPGSDQIDSSEGRGNPTPEIPQLSQGQININTASQADLELLPGIGPVIAQKIIAYRQENGAFQSIADIQNVSGIGPATFEKIREFITIGDAP